MIFPINDGNGEILNEGGSLWSILVYSKAEKNFIIMTQSIISKPYFNIAKTIIIGTSKISNHLSCATYDVNFIKGTEQENSYDCGIYTIAATESVIQLVIRNHKMTSLVIPHISPLDCIKKRSFLTYVIVNSYNTPRDVLMSLMIRVFTSKQHG